MGGNHVDDMVGIYVYGWVCVGLYKLPRGFSLFWSGMGAGGFVWICADLCVGFCMAF